MPHTVHRFAPKVITITWQELPQKKKRKKGKEKEEKQFERKTGNLLFLLLRRVLFSCAYIPGKMASALKT